MLHMWLTMYEELTRDVKVSLQKSELNRLPLAPHAAHVLSFNTESELLALN